jgi:hypothetical protein
MPGTPSEGSTESNSLQRPNDVRGKSGVGGASGPLNAANPDNDNPYASGELIESVVPPRRMSLIEFLFGTILGIFLGVTAGIGTCVTGVSALYGIGFSESTALGAVLPLLILVGSFVVGMVVFVKIFNSFRGRDSTESKNRT